MSRKLSGLAVTLVAAGTLGAAAPAQAVDCATFKTDVETAGNGDTITLDAGLTCHDAPYALPQGTAPFAITIQGGGAGATLDGDGTNRIMQRTTTGSSILDVTIRNLTFTGGSPTSGDGGALLLSGNVGVTLDDDTFLGNDAVNGGAVAISSSNSTRPTLVTNSTFGDGTLGGANSATSEGGALRISNTSASSPSVEVSGNSFARNTTGTRGGALRAFAPAAGTLTVTDNTFTSNGATTEGGGAALQGLGLTFERNTFTGNSVNNAVGSLAKGGGAVVQAQGPGDTATHADNRFDGNRITRVAQVNFSALGGGEWIEGYNLNSRNDRFTNNSLPDPAGSGEAEGGGLGVEGCEFGSVTTTVHLDNAAVAGNDITSGGDGAGVYVGGCTSGPVDLTVRNSTIAGNTTTGAATTGGLFGGPDDTLTMRNSIVAGNSGGQDLRGFTPSPIVTFSDACSPTAPAGAGNVCTDPLLVDPSPGHADVHETQFSPTVDHGSSADVPGALTTDYEGDARIAGPVVDMGADEFTAPTVVTSAAKVIRATKAKLNGTVNPNTRATSYHFEYGETTAYGRSTPAVALPAGNVIVPVSAQLLDLKPSTTYHFRVVGSNSAGTSVGIDTKFTTDPDGFKGAGVPTQVVKVRKGVARIKVGCPKSAIGTCVGKLTLGSAGPVALRLARKGKKLSLGSKRFSIKRGAQRRVRVRISTKGRRALRKFGSLRAIARTKAHDTYVTRKRRGHVTLKL